MQIEKNERGLGVSTTCCRASVYDASGDNLLLGVVIVARFRWARIRNVAPV